MGDPINCQYCSKKKKPRKATKFLVAPGGAHVPLCDSCCRQVKAQAVKAKNQLRKSGHFDSIDPQLRKWLQNPEFATSSDEFRKQQEERLKS